MTSAPPDAPADLLAATEMVNAFGTRVAPAPAAGAVGVAALSFTLVVGWWGLAALAEALLPIALMGGATYWGWRWVDERHGRVYWEPALLTIEAVAVGTWVPSTQRAGSLARVTGAGVDNDDRPWLRLGDGSLLVAEPPRGDVVTAIVRPAPWHGLLDSLPVPERRGVQDLSDDELRAAVKRSFARLSAAITAAIDSGEPLERELVVDLARVLDNGMESVRAYESVRTRLGARPAPAGDAAPEEG